MMRGLLACWLMLIRPVVELGFGSFGWLKKLKKSEVKRNLILSAMSKYLNTERSSFQARGPRKKLRAFQFRRSVMLVVWIFPLARVKGSLLSKFVPSGRRILCDLSTGTSCSSLVKSTLVAAVGSK